MANLKDPTTKSRIVKMKRRSTNRHLDAVIYGEELEKLYKQFLLMAQRIEALDIVEVWWTLYEPLANWERDSYLVGFSYFQFLNDTKNVGYDWTAPGWSTTGGNLGEPDWEDPNAFPYDEGDDMYCHMYLFMEDFTVIPEQPGLFELNPDDGAGVGIGWPENQVVAFRVEDQDGETYTFTNSNLGLNYVDLYASLNDNLAYLMFHLQPFTGSNQDDPLLPEQEYRDNLQEMARLGEKASKGLITSLKIYYRLEGDLETPSDPPTNFNVEILEES